MRWSRREGVDDVVDRRGEGGGGAWGGGGFGSGPRLGLGGIVILLLLSLIFRRNFLALLGGDAGLSGGGGAVEAPARPTDPREDQLVEFVRFVVGDAQDLWTREFQAMGREYQRAKLVLFTDTVRSGCGFAEAAMGPFYCPADQNVYIDLGFYQELKRRFGAPGDFAQAYVIAHEVGHHVQRLLGYEGRVREAQERRPDQANELSIRLELQADCLAGVWGHSTAQRSILEQGDVEEGIGAAAAVGDDRIQKQATGRVNPETWTHGAAEQRVRWFRRGLEGGDLRTCDTFSAPRV